MKIIEMTGDMPPCCCGDTGSSGLCCGLTSSDTLVATLESNDCPAIDGITFDLPSLSSTEWAGNIDDNECLGEASYPNLKIVCENGNWRMEQTLIPPECHNAGSRLNLTPKSVQCDPFELIFDGTLDEPEPGVCGCACHSYPAAFTVKITKKAR